MSADLINLAKARKSRVKAAVQREAATNRVRHGRTAQEREAAEAELAQANRRLNGLRLAARDGAPSDDD